MKNRYHNETTWMKVELGLVALIAVAGFGLGVVSTILFQMVMP